MLKWVGYLVISLAGVCLTVVVSVLLTFIGATMGTLALGASIVVLGAVAIKEYFESKPKDEDT